MKEELQDARRQADKAHTASESEYSAASAAFLHRVSDATDIDPAIALQIHAKHAALSGIGCVSKHYLAILLQNVPLSVNATV